MCLKDLLLGVYKETSSGVFPGNVPREAQSSGCFYGQASTLLL